MRTIWVAVLLVGCGCAHLERAKANIGWEPPTAAEAGLLGISETLTIVDVLQTADLSRHPELTETNALLGASPSRGRLAVAGLSAVLGEAALWYVLPPPLRSVWAAGVGGYELAVDAHHVRIGLSIRLP